MSFGTDARDKSVCKWLGKSDHSHSEAWRVLLTAMFSWSQSKIAVK